MPRLPRPQALQVSCLACVCGALALLFAATASTSPVTAADKAKGKSPITKLTFDPDAEQVEMFDAIDAGKLEVTVIAKDALQGSLLIENKTDKPISVKFPESFVGVPVLKQFGGGQGMGLGTGNSQGGGGNQQQQPFGGGAGGGLGGGFGGGGLGGGIGGGGNFFSVPAEKVVKIPYNSVCLAHGKAEPRPRSTYKLVRTEEFTKDSTLQEVIRLVGTGGMDQQAAQAAAWHITDKMSWQELASKQIHYLGGQGSTPYFSPAQLLRAQGIYSQAMAAAKERGTTEEAIATPATTTPTLRTVRTRTR